VIAALTEPVQVQTVGESWVLLLAGPAMVALAAIGAAMVAARTANKRQREQLAHDLVVRREEHTRDAVDGALETVTETVGRVTELESGIRAAESVRPGLEDAARKVSGDDALHEKVLAELNNVEEKLRSLHREANARLVDMRVHGLRLRLRLESDRIPSLYKRAADTLDRHREALAPGIERALSDREKDAIKAMDADGTSDVAAVMAACASWFQRDATTASRKRWAFLRRRVVR
jgi:hypothetical protein